MSTWDDGEAPTPVPMGVLNYALAGVRVLIIAVIIFGLMVPMLLLRMCGFIHAAQRVVRIACRMVVGVMGIGLSQNGRAMTHPGVVVANHSSWLDIFVLNAVQDAVFVSKAEVAKWPLIGLISRSVGTVFIERKQRHAAQQRDVFAERLLKGHRLLFFPEGTSTDGRRVLGFRSTLFAALFQADLRETVWVQPVSVAYFAPLGRDARYYGWWGDADFFPHFFNVLGQFRQGRVAVVFHAPLSVAEAGDRKSLARVCELAVRGGLADAIEVG